MPDGVDDSLVRIANSIDAHRTELGNVISNVGDKLTHEIQKLEDVILDAARVINDRSTGRPLLNTYQLRLQSLAWAFKPCHEICLEAISAGKTLNDQEFKDIVKIWQECKEQAYIVILSESEYLLKAYKSLEEPFRKLQKDGLRIDSEIRKSGRYDLIDAINSFHEDVHILLSSVSKQSEFEDTASSGKASGGTAR